MTSERDFWPQHKLELSVTTFIQDRLPPHAEKMSRTGELQLSELDFENIIGLSDSDPVNTFEGIGL